MTHDEFKALLPLAALAQLEPDELASLREHLAGCRECDAELREFEHAAAMLALAVESPVLEDRVTRKLEARLAAGTTSTARQAATSVPDRTLTRIAEPPPRREGARRFISRFAIAAAILLAIYGAAVTSRLMDLKRAYDDRGDKLVYLKNRFNTLQYDAQYQAQRIDALSKVLTDRIQLEQVLEAPDLQLTRLAPQAPAPRANALLAVSKASREAVLRASGLDEPPPGKAYEFWWITREQGPVRAGTFTVEAGKDVVAKVNPPPAGDHVVVAAVTLEPAGGVPKPTGAMYLKGSPERE